MGMICVMGLHAYRQLAIDIGRKRGLVELSPLSSMISIPLSTNLIPCSVSPPTVQQRREREGGGRRGGKASSRCQRRNSPIFTIEETHTLISRLTYNHFQWRVHLSYGVGLEEERDWKWNLNSREDSQVPCPRVSPSSLCGPPDRELDRCTSGFRFWEGVGAKQHNETLQVGSRKLGLRRTIFSPLLHSIQILSLWIQGFLVLSRQP